MNRLWFARLIGATGLAVVAVALGVAPGIAAPAGPAGGGGGDHGGGHAGTGGGEGGAAGGGADFLIPPGGGGSPGGGAHGFAGPAGSFHGTAKLGGFAGVHRFAGVSGPSGPAFVGRERQAFVGRFGFGPGWRHYRHRWFGWNTFAAPAYGSAYPYQYYGTYAGPVNCRPVRPYPYRYRWFRYRWSRECLAY